MEPRMEIGFICLCVIFYRGFGDYANFGFRECVVEEVKFKLKRFNTERTEGGRRTQRHQRRKVYGGDAEKGGRDPSLRSG